jgi:MFS family permease
MVGGHLKVKGRTLYRIMSFCCALAFMMYGYDAGVLGGIQTTKPFLNAIGNPKGTYVIPMIASSYTLAAAVCSLAVMVIGMPLGRRNCILLGDAFVIVGATLQATSFSVPQIIIARVLCGFGIGFISCSVPTYMAEMSIESKERGPEVSVQCIFLITGVAIAYWLDFGVSHSTMQLWRFPIAFQGFFALLSGGGMLFLPDTPRWYYAKGREAEGDDVLRRLWDRPIEDPRVQGMKSEIMASIQLEAEEENKFNFLDLIWDRSDLRAGRRIRIAFLILSIQQMMGEVRSPQTTGKANRLQGINLSVYYSTVIFSQVGLSDSLSQLLAAVMATCFAAGTYPLPWTIERFGRRKILIWSAVILTICMIIFVAMIGLPNPTIATQWVAVASIIVYNFVFGYGWIGVPWLYGPEVRSLHLWYRL